MANGNSKDDVIESWPFFADLSTGGHVCCNDDEAMRVVQDVVNTLQFYGGLVVFNSHPIHLQHRISFYQRLLAWFAETQNEVVLAKDLVKDLDV